MNKEIFIVFLFLLFLYLFSCNMEGMRNPLIIPEYEFSILTAPQEVTSGYFQENLCKNDPDWELGDKTCNDILSKDECSLKSDKGVLANDVCLIACDTCPSSVTIKHREPMPISEDTELSARGINIEDSDEYDYMEIYDAFESIDYDIEIINDKYEDFQKKHPPDSLDCPIECLSSDTFTPSTPASSTPAPSTPAPSTPAPSTPAPPPPAPPPPDPAPSTPAPSTPASSTPDPTSSTPAPSTPAPSTPDPAPSTPDPTSSTPCPPGCLFHLDTS
jgi:hypothetical protein